MVMWAMSDRAIPRSLRFMEGFGVHTFQLVNEKDEAVFVKFHWKPKLGLQSTLWDEAAKLQGADNDYHRRDLYEAIEAGDFPQWDLGVQIFTQEQADAFPFDVLDPTKLIPEELVPVQIVGTMTLNRNPDNFFAETEQVAFLPTNLPPGIDFSDDPLLQGRLFSYLDTQLSRLGTPNWHLLPINRAKGCPVHNFQRDGQMQMNVPKGRANYEPNSLAEAGEIAGPRATPAGVRAVARKVSGVTERKRSDSFADHYSQARMFYRSQSETEQNHIVAAIVFELSKVTLAHVRVRMMANLRNVDETLAARVADGLGLDPPPASKPARAPIEMEPSPKLRIIGNYPETLQGRCVAILVTDGSDGKQIDAVKTGCEEAGAQVKIVAPKIGGATLKGGKRLAADAQLAGAPSVLFDAVVVLPSKEGAAKLAADPAAVDWAAHAFVHLKAIGHNAEAAELLRYAGVTPDARVIDVSKKAGDFVKKAAGREWAREKPQA
jgi:catalase